MSVVAVSSNVLDAGSIPAISTPRISKAILKRPKTPVKSGVFAFLLSLAGQRCYVIFTLTTHAARMSFPAGQHRG